jgi:hypothetical protein
MNDTRTRRHPHASMIQWAKDVGAGAGVTAGAASSGL